MHHPLEKLSPVLSKKLFWLLLVGSILTMAFMNIQGAPLVTSAAPLGIVSYELAGSPARMQAILDSWDEFARQSAAFNLGFDYLFMAIYSTAIALACLLAGAGLRSCRWPFGKAAPVLAWGLWLAALFDAIENWALTTALFSVPASPLPEIARWCALLKFGLIFTGLVYAFLGLAVWLAMRLTRRD
jgi:hypothetical protein